MVAVKSLPSVLAVMALLVVGTLAQSTRTTAAAPAAAPATAAPNNGVGTCGSQRAGAACADSTHCCSRFGFCGVGFDNFNKLDYCGDGCQGGPCRDGFKKLGGAPVTSNTTASPTSPAKAGSAGAAAPAVVAVGFAAAASLVLPRLN